jgi:uncharacterized Ntn-hydrolase superfamily protein
MKNKITRILFIFLLPAAIFIAGHSSAQDTFSICAVDSVTGEVGSAGATCISSAAVSAIIISDVHPGRGVIHTQALWDPNNQNYAKSLMNAGLSPQQIIDSVTFYDINGDSTVRQYGAVDLNGGSPRSAGFTGSGCSDYKNHIAGPGYSIQGNILLGQQILDSMEARYLNASGTLACKLMAALQGAKVVGADTRCLTHGISSYSAFIRVARPQDTTGTYILDLTVNTYPGSIEPIDTLQSMLNNLGGCNFTSVAEMPVANNFFVSIFPNPVREQLSVIRHPVTGTEQVSIYSMTGKKIFQGKFSRGINVMTIDTRNFPSGIYSVNIHSADYKTSVTRKMVVQQK